MDGWSNRRNRPHLNVMVSSPIRTVFWKSVRMEGKEKDSKAYFKILDGVIKEIGSNAVVGVVMDNARVCVKAGKMVEAAYPQIFRVGCTAHALDLALEDMYKQLGWLAVVVDADNVVGKFFTYVDKARAMFDKFSPNLKLKRPAVTRFATSHDMSLSMTMRQQQQATGGESSASSSSSSDDEDASGSGVESMEHGEGDGDGTGDSSEGSEGQSGEEEEGDGGEE
ncbi:hypothetical protein CBR_g8629 [Chara braunii]|uniref:DUF659 domain-containing protein n=1 Tax=Chara braunii TaxID=69332 RepID=A0A388JS32_CHABU|nr:hypothetical protein CBR_g8629 [Chara braunii]|eukprot:GBG60608.1 hypothetical protein CBR_g8629 [Chara braunii]